MSYLKVLSYALLIVFSLDVSAQRKVTNLNHDWKFLLDDDAEFSSEDYDDVLWTTLDVPHDWSFEKGVRIGGDQGQGGGYHDGGVAWYRKTITIEKSTLDKVLYINYDGVYMNSEVWINGHYLGKRPYGYISFRYDISQYLKKGNNTIAVRVDNSLEPSARWYHPCGIYAPVQLIEVSKNHILPNSIFITTPEILEYSAKVNTTVKISSVDRDLSYKLSIISPEGDVLVTTSTFIGGNMELSLMVDVEDPILWSPESPILYQANTQLYDGTELVDEVITYFGFRTINWSAETGFWLNGKNVKLKGVCEHWEGGPVGGAWTKPMLRWKLQSLKDMGINAIRPSHNPTPPMFYDICDEIGLLVMDEIFDGWSKKAPQDYGKQAFAEWWKRDIQEWITRDRNHPSIFVYSLGNETHGDIASELVGFSRNLDSTRLYTSGAGNSEDMDIIGVNGGSENKTFIEGIRFEKPFISTEAPHTWQTRGYYRTHTWWRDNALPGTYDLPNLTEKEIFFYEGIDPKNWKNRKQRFNSSYDNATVRICARKNWEVMRDNPWHSGHFRWTGFDYYGEAGLVHGGLPFNLFMGGALDVAGFKKDLFYFYQSQWTEEIMLHILPSWTHPRMKQGTVIPVWVYSNADEVELFLNGKSLGKDEPGLDWDAMQCDWMVPYQSGTLEAVAYVDGKEVKRKVLNTSKEPFRLNNSVEKLESESGFESSFIISTKGADLDGNLYPYAENKVYYHLNGDIRKVSIENGNPIDPTSRTKANYRSMFFGEVRLFLQAKEDAKNASLITGSILGDKALYLSNEISIDIQTINLFGEVSAHNFIVKYTTDGSDPLKQGLTYDKPFKIKDGTLVRAVVFSDDEMLFFMEEKFGNDYGLFWGDEHSADIWIGRGVNLGAEEASLAGSATISTDAYRYKGSGFVKFDGKEGAVTWFRENDGEAGDFSIRFRYMHNNIDQLHPMKLYVNDVYVKTFEFNPTGGWEKEWKFVNTIVNLQSGANYIRLESSGQSAPYLDELFID